MMICTSCDAEAEVSSKSVFAFTAFRWVAGERKTHVWEGSVGASRMFCTSGFYMIAEFLKLALTGYGACKQVPCEAF
jgi:hypothetical protein